MPQRSVFWLTVGFGIWLGGLAAPVAAEEFHGGCFDDVLSELFQTPLSSGEPLDEGDFGYQAGVSETIEGFQKAHGKLPLFQDSYEPLMPKGSIELLSRAHRARLKPEGRGLVRMPVQRYYLKNTLNKSRNDLAAVNFSVWGDELFIDMVSTLKDARQKGYSTYMLAEVQRRHPQTKRYVAILAESNAAVLETKLRDGWNLNDAYRATPLFKSMRKFGYERIVKIKSLKMEDGWHAFGVVVERPK